jgi:hypothetical protein
MIGFVPVPDWVSVTLEVESVTTSMSVVVPSGNTTESPEPAAFSAACTAVVSSVVPLQAAPNDVMVIVAPINVAPMKA